MLRLLAFAGLSLLIAAPGFAQKRKRDDGPRKEGEYQGVRPGRSEFKPRSSRAPRITWVGFMPKASGTSKFFVQVNKTVEYEQRLDDKGVLYVTINRGRFSKRNNRRRLDTRFFDTAVATVHLRRVRRSRARKGRPAQAAGVRLAFRFKTPEDAQQAQLSLQKEEDGYHYLYLDFAPAKERPAEGNDKDRKPVGGDDDVAR